MTHDLMNNVQAVFTAFLNQQKTNQKPTLKPLLGGRSGAGLYTFSLENRKYVLRMFAEMEEIHSRERESKVTNQVAQLGFAPKVYYVDPEYRGMM